MQGLWRDACKAAAALLPRYDVLDEGMPIITSGECLPPAVSAALACGMLSEKHLGHKGP
jgi:hypothetical protein